MQHLLILLLFMLAVGYLARLIHQHFQADKGCAKGCGSCSAVDLEKIQKQISEQV